MNHMISVIVPIFNVEKYISECINSIITQSYDLLEIILIDDGSTDNSGKICDEYALLDKRIIVVHQANMGSASAKNIGLCLASGFYLSFVDGDDILEDNAYKKLIDTMENKEADIVQGSFSKLYLNSKEKIIQNPLEENNKQFLIRYTTDWSCGLLWDKLFKKELFKNIYFEEGNVIDDEFFTYQGVMNANKIVRISDLVYQYRQRKNGVMTSEEKKERIVLDKLHYLTIRREKINKRFPSLSYAFDEHYLNMLLILSHDESINEQTINEVKRLIKNYFENEHKYYPPFSMRIKLARVQYMSNKKLLLQKNIRKNKIEMNHYFE